MYLFAEGEIRTSVQAEPFKDENGMDVVYYENVVETDDGQLNLNSKDDFSAVAKTRGVIKIRVKQLYSESGFVKGHKLTLAGFTQGESMDEPEEVVS